VKFHFRSRRGVETMKRQINICFPITPQLLRSSVMGF